MFMCVQYSVLTFLKFVALTRLLMLLAWITATAARLPQVLEAEGWGGGRRHMSPAAGDRLGNVGISIALPHLRNPLLCAWG
jgi:hypothetical protein